jgi:hypothetical protein
MKSVPKASVERVRGLEASSRSEKRFRYPALEEISEISCRTDPQRWTENDQPGEIDGTDVRVS